MRISFFFKCSLLCFYDADVYYNFPLFHALPSKTIVVVDSDVVAKTLLSERRQFYEQSNLVVIQTNLVLHLHTHPSLLKSPIRRIFVFQ